MDLTSKNWYYPSITCNQDNSIKRLIYFVRTMSEDEAVIVNFHSILKKTDPGYGKDRWYNDVTEFEKLCKYLSTQSNIKVITNKELHNIIYNSGHL